MLDRSLLDQQITRGRMLRLMAGAAAIPAASQVGGLAREATPPSATPVSSPGATPISESLDIRKNAKSLSSTEKAAYTDAILALKATPSPWDASLSTYDQFVVWHRDAF